MIKLVITTFALLGMLNLYTQVFKGTGGYIQDYAGYYYRQEYLCEVFNLPPKIDSFFGIESVQVTLHHNRSSDLKLTLIAPDGSSVWLANRNGRDSGKNYLQTTFNMDAKNYIHQANAPFSGTFIPDGRMEYLNNGQNPNGYWKLAVEDLREEIDGQLDSFSIIFGHQPAKLRVIKKCSFEDPRYCVCEKGRKNKELLPDLVMVPSFTQNQIKEYAWNDSSFPGQLRFAATIANIGYGPMEIKGSRQWFCGNIPVDSGVQCKNGIENRQMVLQRIYYKSGDELKFRETPAGTMYYDNHAGHNHYHVDNWVEFRLFSVVKGIKKKVAITKGNKISFCLFSTGICTTGDSVCKMFNKSYGEDMPNFGLGTYSSCGVDKQGITVGGYDTYGMMYEGQYLQLPKGLKSGTYLLEIEIDPDHRYLESNRKNNVLSMPVTINQQE